MTFEEWMAKTFDEPEWSSGWERADVEAAWNESRRQAIDEAVKAVMDGFITQDRENIVSLEDYILEALARLKK